jgi:hypothetical protein
MNESTPAFGVDFGTPGEFRWSVDRAVLCVYLNASGDLNRAVWQLESRSGTRFDCVFAVSIEGAIACPPTGERLTAALRALPDFDAITFALARAAVEGARPLPTGGRFVCWERSRAPIPDHVV